jgi:hypothetical protein
MQVSIDYTPRNVLLGSLSFHCTGLWREAFRRGFSMACHSVRPLYFKGEIQPVIRFCYPRASHAATRRSDYCVQARGADPRFSGPSPLLFEVNL